MRRLVTLIAAADAATVLSTSVRTEVTLRASHQFPGGKGDVRDVRAGKDAQAYYEGKAKQVDDATIKIFKDHGVEVISLTPGQYDAWIEVAKQSSYKQFAMDMPDGQKPIDEALPVK